MRTDVVGAIRDLGLSRRAVCAHCSLRSFGHLSGGARTLVDAFLDEQSTLLVPSFSWGYSTVPAEHAPRPLRNGTRYDFPKPSLPERLFDTASTEVDGDMGALSAAVVTDPERVRGNHPICSFSAVGPLAETLVEGQEPHAVWAPLERLVEVDGAVVLMGVDFTRLTLIHLAEQRVGRRPFVRWAATESGRVSGVQVGSCSDGFSKLAPSLTNLVERRMVGPSEWTAMSAGDALDRLVAEIAASPAMTQCTDPECERCRDALMGGPVV